MSQSIDTVTLAVLCGVGALALLWMWGRPNSKPDFTFTELADLIEKVPSFKVDPDPKRKITGADKSVRLYTERLSIIYHSTKRKEGTAETIDIASPSKMGVIISLFNGHITVLEYFGKADVENPALALEERAALNRFLATLHKHLERT
jgi:hypothetical protein